VSDLLQHVRVELDVEVGSDPIRGSLRTWPDAPARHFQGWIELASVLDALVNAADDRPREPAPG
jgi:hypothetical protein